MAKRSGNEKKITIEIDPQLRTDFHIYARKRGSTVKALIEEWIRETLELAGTYSSPQYRPLVESLLMEGKHTQSEITKIVCQRLPGVKKADVQQLVSDAKSRRKFAHSVIELEPRKCLGFGKLWEAEAQDITNGDETLEASN
jgi:hypothetical protein